MKTERFQAIVLRRTNFGEADRILQFITSLGRRSAVARGVRKEKSKLAGGVELFAISDIVVGKGKGDLGVLISARLVDFYKDILKDFDRMQFGYEALRLVGRASETADDPAWFDVLAQVLAALNTEKIDIRLVQIWFYLRYAELLGYGLGLRYDINGALLNAATKYRYDINDKGFARAETGDISADHIKFLRLMATKPIKTIAQIGGVEDILGACLLVARQHAAVPTT